MCRVDGALSAKIEQFKVLLLARNGRDKAKGPGRAAGYAQEVAESFGCGAGCTSTTTTLSSSSFSSSSSSAPGRKSMPPGLEELKGSSVYYW